MKLRNQLVLAATLFSSVAMAQTNSSPWPTTTPFVGIGTGTVAPVFNLQLHGTADYITLADKAGNPGLNYGKTTRIGLTNLTTGALSTDGGLIRMSDNNFVIQNQEAGAPLILNTNTGNISMSNSIGSTLSMISTKTFIGQTGMIAGVNYATFNVLPQNGDNGAYIRASLSGKYALALKANSDADAALLVYGTNATSKTFSVQGSGATVITPLGLGATDKVLTIYNTDGVHKVLQLTNDGKLRTREVIVDLVEWADYVFKPSYSLMPLNKVEEYIKINGHLPNVKSAQVIESEGLGLGEINKTLMEKVEELTLYLIEQQKTIETLKTEVSEMKVELNKGN